MTYEANCPECDASLSLRDPMEGEIVPCPDCGVDLEVVSLNPLSSRAGARGRRGLGRMIRVAVLISRIRVEEKLLLAALEAAGAAVQIVNDSELVFALGDGNSVLDADVVLERSVSTARGLYALRLFEHAGPAHGQQLLHRLHLRRQGADHRGAGRGRDRTATRRVWPSLPSQPWPPSKSWATRP